MKQSEIRDTPQVRHHGFAIQDQVVRRQGASVSAMVWKRSVQS